MDDLISRREAIDALNEQIEYCNKALGSFDISPKDEYAVKVERASLKVYKEQLENLPSAQQEQKKGKWIPLFDGRFTGGAYWFHCSKCERVVPDVRNGGWNFCPNCGADMMEETK